MDAYSTECAFGSSFSIVIPALSRDLPASSLRSEQSGFGRSRIAYGVRNDSSKHETLTLDRKRQTRML